MSTFVATPPALVPKSFEVIFVFWEPPAWLSLGTRSPLGTRLTEKKTYTGARSPVGWTAHVRVCPAGLKPPMPMWCCHLSSRVSVTSVSDLYGVSALSISDPKELLWSALPQCCWGILFTCSDFPLRHRSPRTEVGSHLVSLQAPRTRRCCWWPFRTSVPRRQPAS